jgi:hypothetical protein
MTSVTIYTRHGHTIQTTVPDLDTAKKMLGQPFIVAESADRFTAIATSGIEVLDAQTIAAEDSTEPTE